MIYDLICLLIVVLFVILGVRKGFTQMLLRTLSFIIAILLALLLQEPMTQLIYRTEIPNQIEGYLMQTWEKKAPDSETEQDRENYVIEDEEEAERESVFWRKWIGDIKDDGEETIVQSAAGQMTAMIVKLISVLLVIVLSKLILHFLCILLDFLTSLPVLKQCNRFLGAVLGLINGLIVLEILCLILHMCEMTTWASNIIIGLEQSEVAQVLYLNDIFTGFLIR